MVRGLITWQWAPDRRPARQTGSAPHPGAPGSTFEAPRRVQRDASTNKKAGFTAGLSFFPLKSSYQPAFTACDTHQPFAATDLPGNNWQGP